MSSSLSSRFSRRPVAKLSSTRTSCPSVRRRSTSDEPMNPPPPVTRTLTRAKLPPRCGDAHEVRRAVADRPSPHRALEARQVVEAEPSQMALPIEHPRGRVLVVLAHVLVPDRYLHRPRNRQLTSLVALGSEHPHQGVVVIVDNVLVGVPDPLTGSPAESLEHLLLQDVPACIGNLEVEDAVGLEEAS